MKKAGKRMSKKELAAALVGFFQMHEGKVVSTKEIFHTLRLTTHPLKMLCVDILYDFLDEGSISSPQNGYYCYSERASGNPSARERYARGSTDTFVGTLKVNQRFAFFSTESKMLDHDAYIPLEQLHGGKTGDKVVVRITAWPSDARNPIGEVVDVLGRIGDNNAEMHAVLAEYGLPYTYPENVVAAAEHISEKITPEDLEGRLDFREVTTFTIDPYDAKDFDDALSIRQLRENRWEVGVHIADVTHYVKEGSVIDKEAQQRATSVYLVDRTIPMLPERLCNLICSLRPHEEKLTYAVIFELNERAEVKHTRIARTIIQSNRRFTYEEAQQIIEQGEGEFAQELTTLNRLAQILRTKRFEAGAINFERCEVKFNIDEQGKPLSVYFKEAKEANKLIEEFMLLANRTVAEKIGKVPRNQKPKVFPYRIHDLPDPDKLENLKQFIHRFGYKLRTTGNREEVAKSINTLLSSVKGHNEQNLIETVSLRAMQKARYSTENIGHYGLAFDFYTHFTSPIRRYPDMMVHRLLTRYMDGGRSVQRERYEDLCEHCSAMEQTAAAAERTSVKYKQVEFMSSHLGEVYEGVVSGINEWGIYVELQENKCEGFIPIADLPHDYYYFDERNYSLLGRRHNERFSLGDKLSVQVASANLEKRQLNFVLAEQE